MQWRRHTHVQRLGNVHVEHLIRLHIGLREVGGGDVDALPRQLRIDGVVHEVFDLVASHHHAHVVEPIIGQIAAQAERQAEVHHIAAELRRETTGEALDEGEAIGIGRDSGDGVCIGNVVHDRDLGTYRLTVGVKVRDLHGAFRPGEHAAPRVRVAEEEAALGGALRPIAEGIELAACADVHAKVGEQLEVVAYFRRAPDLRGGLADGGVAGGDQASCVRALYAAAGGVGLAKLAAQIQKAVAA